MLLEIHIHGYSVGDMGSGASVSWWGIVQGWYRAGLRFGTVTTHGVKVEEGNGVGASEV